MSLLTVLIFSFLLSPVLLSYGWAHLLVSIFVLFNIHRLARYYLFWIFFALVLLGASELRLSLEYFLLSAGAFAYALSPQWQSSSRKTQSWSLLLAFVLFYFIDFFNFNYVEKGSVLMFVPVFLAAFFPLQKSSFKNTALYFPAFFVSLFSNKRTTLLAYLASLKNLFSKYILIAISCLVIVLSFVLKDSLLRFYQKSIAPRVLIWNSSFKAFKEKPVLGHGFGTFAIDFPPYRTKRRNVLGAQDVEYVVHGHSQLFHQIFELGIFGFLLFLTLLYLVFKYANNAFLPFLVISVFNVSLQSLTQVFLFALIFAASIFNESNAKRELIFARISNQALLKFLKILLIVLSFGIFSISILGHHYFDQERYSKAIKYDSYHPLYHFSRGALKINKNIEEANQDLARAVELAPGLGYNHAFYAATLLGIEDIEKAKIHIKQAIRQMGNDAYLLLLSSFINHDDEELSQKHYKKALEINPDLEFLLNDPSYTADEFIGVKASNPRLMAFYRRGRKLFLPLPYIEKVE